ncbi:MAG: tetratricopeptide (TPR) repeat protein [Arenicella sp.]|jgi:tetratricopeptide (TPR) repeat protein
MKNIRYYQLVFFVFLVGFQSYGQVSVERNPFLKWKATSHLMEYAKVSIEPVGGNGTLLSNQISNKQGVIIKLEKPKGFVESEGKIFFGLGVRVINVGLDKEVLNVEDIYESNEGVSAELLQNLSLRFSPDTTAKPFDIYLVKARFFDKKSDGEVLIEIPFSIRKNSDISFSTHNYSSWSISPSYKLIGQNLPLEESEIQLDGNSLNQLHFSSDSKLSFKVDVSKFQQKNYSSYYYFTDSKGNTVSEAGQAFPESWNGKLDFELPKSLQTEPYLLTVSVESASGRMGFSEWFFYTGEEKSLNSKQKEEFSEVFMKIAKRLNVSKNSRDALQVLDNAISYNPNNAQAFYEKAWANNELNRAGMAETNLKNALKVNPNYLAADQELAYTYKKQKKYELAIAQYEKIVETHPNHYKSYYELGWLANEMKQYDRAVEVLSKAIELNINNFYQPYSERVLANKRLGKLDAVVQDYEKLSEMFPANADYPYQIGYYKIDLKDYLGAIEALDKSIEIDLYNYKPIYEKAYAQKMLGNYKEAIKGFEYALEIGKSKVPNAVNLYLGDCLYALENRADACEYYEKAKKLKVKNAFERVKEFCGK